ncbi:MAG: metal-dependent phosphoesterase [Thermoplasmata archaeon HGW-Thermoplasmata-1]|nr:MAG: metal-dependent phosphoesterase [Thermoplasmata archaeon HGW-Thermoplasmata-1]
MKLDMHVHTRYSPDGIGEVKDLVGAVMKKGLDGMAIADHNTCGGAIEALKLKRPDFLIVPAIEITTLEGDILAYGITKPVKRDMTAAETVEAILGCGGIPVAPHPCRPLSGMGETVVKSLYGRMPAIEVFNSKESCRRNDRAAALAKELKLGGTAGSDAHSIVDAGNAYTIFDGADCLDDVLALLEKGRTWGEGEKTPAYVVMKQKLKTAGLFVGRGFKRI